MVGQRYGWDGGPGEAAIGISWVSCGHRLGREDCPQTYDMLASLAFETMMVEERHLGQDQHACCCCYEAGRSEVRAIAPRMNRDGSSRRAVQEGRTAVATATIWNSLAASWSSRRFRDRRDLLLKLV